MLDITQVQFANQTPKRDQRSKDQRRRDRLMSIEARPHKTCDDAYVTGGDKYHPCWCSAVNGNWLSGALKLKIVPMLQAIADGKELCSLCVSECGFVGK